MDFAREVRQAGNFQFEEKAALKCLGAGARPAGPGASTAPGAGRRLVVRDVVAARPGGAGGEGGEQHTGCTWAAGKWQPGGAQGTPFVREQTGAQPSSCEAAWHTVSWVGRQPATCTHGQQHLLVGPPVGVPPSAPTPMPPLNATLFLILALEMMPIGGLATLPASLVWTTP